jgi:hypothetical protein
MTEHESTIDLNPAADEIIDDRMAVDDGTFRLKHKNNHSNVTRFHDPRRHPFKIY